MDKYSKRLGEALEVFFDAVCEGQYGDEKFLTAHDQVLTLLSNVSIPLHIRDRYRRTYEGIMQEGGLSEMMPSSEVMHRGLSGLNHCPGQNRGETTDTEDSETNYRYYHPKESRRADRSKVSKTVSDFIGRGVRRGNKGLKK